MKRVFLDHNATTPLRPEVADTMARTQRDAAGNPSSNTGPGREARQAVDRARAQVATAVGATSAEIVFCSGGTEANNHAIFGSIARSRRTHTVTSAVEHQAWFERFD